MPYRPGKYKVLNLGIDLTPTIPLVYGDNSFTFIYQIINYDLYSAILGSDLDFDLLPNGDLQFNSSSLLCAFWTFIANYYGYPPPICTAAFIKVHTFTDSIEKLISAEPSATIERTIL